ncbi:MAG: ABC transporter permease [Vicinamibacteria bacterium]|nr:ABC transporter permease [Vicinamibacteria bacterium]
MSIPLDLSIALRYLLKRQGAGFLTVIASIAVLGIAVGVMALFVSLGLMTGLQGEIRGRILGTTAHVSVFKSRGEAFTDPTGIAALVGKVPGVLGAAPSLYGKALVSSPSSQAVVTIKGISASEGEITDLPKQVKEGSIDDLPPHGEGFPGILLGREVSTVLAVGPGDVVTLTIPRGRLTPFGVMPQLAKFRVAGVVQTGLYEFDAGWGWIALLEAERLLASSGAGTVLVEARLQDMYDVDAAEARIVQAVGSDYVTSDWIETNRSLFEALQLEKIAITLTIGLIMLVAALNIVATLIIMVTEKRRSIAVLMSLGATREVIRRVFVWQGAVLGAVGTLLGAAAGTAACLVLDRFQLIRIPADVYQVAYLPFKLLPTDAAVVVVGAMVVSLVATLYPAGKAASLQPTEGLRSE